MILEKLNYFPLFMIAVVCVEAQIYLNYSLTSTTRIIVKDIFEFPLTSNQLVRHIQVVPGQETLLLIVGYAIFRYNLKNATGSTLIAGKVDQNGFKNSKGGKARFSEMNSLLLSKESLLVADTQNHCLRIVNLANTNVSTYAGKCTHPGGHNSIGTQSLFIKPRAMLFDKFFPTRMFVGESCSIRSIDVQTTRVSTLENFCYQSSSQEVKILSLSWYESYLLVSSDRFLMRREIFLNGDSSTPLFMSLPNTTWSVLRPERFPKIALKSITSSTLSGIYFASANKSVYLLDLLYNSITHLANLGLVESLAIDVGANKLFTAEAGSISSYIVESPTKLPTPKPRGRNKLLDVVIWMTMSLILCIEIILFIMSIFLWRKDHSEGKVCEDIVRSRINLVKLQSQSSLAFSKQTSLMSARSGKSGASQRLHTSMRRINAVPSHIGRNLNLVRDSQGVLKVKRATSR